MFSLHGARQTLERYLALPLPPNCVTATYVYIDGLGNLASKTRTLDREPKTVEGQCGRI